MQKKSILKIFLNILVALIISIIIATFLMILIYALPSNSVATNVEKSILNECTSEAHTFILNHNSFRVDQLSEILMMQNAMSIKWDNCSLLDLALSNYNLREAGSDSTYQPLYDYFTGVDADFELEMYGRYWHGYLLWLKPLLMLFTLSQIKMIVASILFLLLLYAIKLINDNFDFGFTLAFLISILVVNPITCSLTLIFYASYAAMLIAIILLLKFKDKSQIFAYYLFFFIGILVGFTDLMTYPLITLFMPLIVFLYLQRSKELKSVASQLKAIILASFSWLFGYAGMWAGKWVVASIFTKNNVVKDALNQVLLRMGQSGTGNIDKLDVIVQNLTVVLTSPILYILLIIFAVFLLFAILKVFDFNNFKLELPIFLILVIPFAWYSLITNHSFVHFWMTYRLLAITIFALLTIILPRIKFSNFKKGLSK